MFYYPFSAHTHTNKHAVYTYINLPFGREGVSQSSIHPSRSQTTDRYLCTFWDAAQVHIKFSLGRLPKAMNVDESEERLRQGNRGPPRTLTSPGASKDAITNGRHEHKHPLGCCLSMCVCAMAIRKRKLLRL